MRIRNNVSGARSYRSYSAHTGALSKNLEKLSTGYRINRSADDAAGLTISEKMRAQITGLDGAQRNAKEGIGLIQTTEGALQEYHAILNRMLELSEESANGVYDDTVDRQQLQKEMICLLQELNRIADSTNFNGVYTLNRVSEEMAETATETATLQSAGDVGNQLAQLFSGSDGAVEATLFWNHVEDDFDFHCITPDGAHICWNIRSGGGGILESVSGSDNSGPLDGQRIMINGETWTGEHIYFPTAVSGGAYKFMAHKWSDSPPMGDSTVILHIKSGETVKNVTLHASDMNHTYPSGAPAYTTSTRGYSQTFEIVAEDNAASLLNGDSSETGDASENQGPIRLLIGETAEKCNLLTVPRFNMHTNAVGLAAIDISTQSGAFSAMGKIKGAVNQVSDVRGTYGALQNRLEHAINYLDNARENVQSSESTIRDTDMADEMSKYTKNSILSQSAQSMLAQANMLPESVLRLIQP